MSDTWVKDPTYPGLGFFTDLDEAKLECNKIKSCNSIYNTKCDSRQGYNLYAKTTTKPSKIGSCSWVTTIRFIKFLIQENLINPYLIL